MNERLNDLFDKILRDSSEIQRITNESNKTQQQLDEVLKYIAENKTNEAINDLSATVQHLSDTMLYQQQIISKLSEHIISHQRAIVDISKLYGDLLKSMNKGSSLNISLPDINNNKPPKPN